ncbi:CDP-alcohol phosphatidyltransferase family protein [Methylocystis sp. WRRC1]|uniref:CDP-alcohol phosphatidyltransferase family protein n=1 Tax=Methylocystis sp. WRRC1 TaxID=1732014 RepID=UPI001D13E3C6|nr:CDP-alcohol phosphatidyltransferase family protein [Methylocystis sp. WRRC1]MCC3247333.1 CDP-alcohol phosphatidyltransferase family protein [Methylocystis sp. WRRC1]
MAFNWFASLPNFITIARLVLTPAAISFIVDENWRMAFAIFATAAASDALDGWLARTFRLQSELGAILDPIADKALIVSIYVSLAILGVLPSWLTIMVVSRDVMIIGAVVISWLMSRPVKVQPHLASKATTAAQLALAGVVLAGKAFGAQFFLLDAGLVGLVAALTVASTAVYLWLWFQHMRP